MCTISKNKCHSNVVGGDAQEYPKKNTLYMYTIQNKHDGDKMWNVEGKRQWIYKGINGS